MSGLDDAHPDIDVFPAGAGPAGTVLVLPGGGYLHHTAERHERWLTTLGFHVVVFRYPVRERHPAPVDAAANALRMIREGSLGITSLPGRVAVLGSSAGGHLASCLAVGMGAYIESGRTARPDLALLCYPVISFAHDVHEGSVERLIGASPTASARFLLSTDQHVDEKTPPVFIWATAEDRLISASHALRFATAMVTARRPVELHLFPHGPHGMGLAEHDPHVSQWTELAHHWLSLNGWC